MNHRVHGGHREGRLKVGEFSNLELGLCCPVEVI